NLSDEKFEEALARFNDTHIDYRNFLYKELATEEDIYFARLTRAAQEAKVLEDRRNQTLQRLDQYPALKAAVVRQHGTVEAYEAHLLSEDEKKVDDMVLKYMDSYN